MTYLITGTPPSIINLDDMEAAFVAPGPIDDPTDRYQAIVTTRHGRTYDVSGMVPESAARGALIRVLEGLMSDEHRPAVMAWAGPLLAGNVDEERPESVADVVAAWTVQGPAPDLHRSMQARLRREWPILARALDKLAREV